MINNQGKKYLEARDGTFSLANYTIEYVATHPTTLKKLEAYAVPTQVNIGKTILADCCVQGNLMQIGGYPYEITPQHWRAVD